jgi:two-component system sensor histidine kinase KdpD
MADVQRRPLSLAPELRGYVAAVALVAVAIGAALVLRRLPHANLSLLFLLAVLIVAAVWGLWPSVAASLLGFLALNFFFTSPLYTLSVEEEGDLATLVFFLAMAALTGNLTARMRAEMARSRAALGRISALLDFSRRIGGAVDADAALTALTVALAEVFAAPASAWLESGDGELRLRALSPGCDAARFDARLLEARFRSGESGAAAAHGPIAAPLAAGGRRLGLVAIDTATATPEQIKLMQGLCEQAAIAVERIRLVDELKDAQLTSRAEQLRSALLASVSHDLKTPLASIIGSVSSVLEYGTILKPEDQRALLDTVLAESQRLNRYIQNLLDMTRFGRERIELEREWVDTNDLISGAVARLGAALDHVRIDIDVSREASPMFVQGALIEQVLVNVLDNAASFSEPGDAIRISARLEGDSTIVEALDQGPGIAADERAKVFDMFYSAQHGDRRRSGAGLGLAICRSIVEAHGGTITALPGDGDRGTRMRIALPMDSNPVGAPAG